MFLPSFSGKVAVLTAANQLFKRNGGRKFGNKSSTAAAGCLIQVLVRMDVPQHLWRFPTSEAIESLSQRFGFPNFSDMQDWEWQVADPDRIDEFLAAYCGGELNEDERFTIMETILQSFSEREGELASDPRWRILLAELERNIDLHAHTVWYWSYLSSESVKNWFLITPYMREILARHRSQFEQAYGV